MKEFESEKFLSKEEVRELQLLGVFHPVRKVTLMNGDRVYIDRVTGITCSLEEEQERVGQRVENYYQRMKLKYQLNELNQEENF